VRWKFLEILHDVQFDFLLDKDLSSKRVTDGAHRTIRERLGNCCLPAAPRKNGLTICVQSRGITRDSSPFAKLPT
jgi:hypothetical protein